MAAIEDIAGRQSKRWATVPDELKALRQWVVWRWDDVPDPKTGEIVRKKMPYQAARGPLRTAAINRPQEWRTFQDAVAVIEATGNTFEGLFFALTEEGPYSALDTDNCIDPLTLEFLPWQGKMVGYPAAEKIVKHIDSYTEVTPSGNGLRTIMRGKKPGAAWSTIGGHDSGSIELYDKNKFVSFTGRHLPGTPLHIMDREKQIANVYERVLEQKNARKAPPPDSTDSIGFTGRSPLMSDEEIIFRAKRANNGAKFAALFGGSLLTFASASDADQSLVNMIAFWTQDPAQIDSIFRSSGLFRKKWRDRADYREMTINTALSGLRNRYSGPKRRATTSGAVEDEGGADEEQGDSQGEGSAPIDLGEQTTQALITSAQSDAGNAEILALLYGDMFRHDHTRSKKGEGWVVWDEGYWRVDDDGMARRAALDAVRERKKAAFTLDDGPVHKKLLAFAVASENNSKQQAMLQSASVMGCFTSRINDYDRDQWLAGVKNGTIDLRTGEIREPMREDLITMRLGTHYDPKATAPRWLQFLKEVFLDDQDVIAYIQRAWGYCLTGSQKEQKAFIAVGDGANGKSIFLTIMRAMLGQYADSAAFTTFDANKRNDSTDNDLAGLKGKRVVTVIESNEDRRLDEARIKSITGGDPIKCRFLFNEFFTYIPTYKLWMAMNHRPLIRGTDNGIWRRIQLIEFNQTFVEMKPGVKLEDHQLFQDKELEGKLLGELPGILNWALEGLRIWLSSGLGEAKAIRAATENYRKESDLVGQWFADMAHSNPAAFTKAADAYTSYAAWCKQFGYPTMSQTSFGKDLGRKSYQSGKKQGSRGYLGFELSTGLDDD